MSDYLRAIVAEDAALGFFRLATFQCASRGNKALRETADTMFTELMDKYGAVLDRAKARADADT